MRDDVVEASAVVGHPPHVVWQIVGSPEWYSRFAPDIAGFDVVMPAGRGRGPRGMLRIAPERGGGLIETPVQAVVYRQGEHVVWCGVPDEGNWVSLEVRPLAGERTELFVRAMVSPAHVDLISSIKKDIRAAARRMDLYLSGRPEPGAENPQNKAGKVATTSTLIRAGVLAPARPDKLAKQLNALAQWGATIAGGYQASAGRVPDERALHDERCVRTFAQADDRSNRLANALAELGVGERDRIALLCRNHAAMVESFIAAGKLGADVVLLNTGLSAKSVADVIAEHRPVAVLADDEFAETIAGVPGKFARISTWPDAEAGYPTVDELIISAPADRPKPVQRPGRLIVLTSGTSGTPKGARRPTPKGLSTAAAILSRIPLRAADRIVVAAPLFHSWGLAAMQLGMALRSSLALVRKFDAEETLRTIAEQKGDALFAVPIMLQRILDLPERVRNRYDLSSLRIVASSGSAMSGPFVTSFMDNFGDVLYNFYGSTEVSWASIADPADLRAAPTTAGRCPPGTVVAILDEERKPVAPGREGQIFVGNDMLFEGYTNGNAPARAADLMATGDVGYLDAAGRLFVTGRADEMIVSGGENVFPRPVEEALVALPGVHDAAVVGVADAEYGQRLAAYVVPRRGAALVADDIRQHIHQRLARFAVPRDVYFVPDLPRNATGKILKRLLHDDTWPVTEY